MFDNQDEPEEQNFWISYADLATGFLIVFLVITFILQDRQRGADELKGKYTEVVKAFEEKMLNLESVELDSASGTVRFLAGSSEKGDKLLFKPGGYKLEDYFKSLLDDFLPILKDQIIGIKKDSVFFIKEIRIEGHTDNEPFVNSKNDPYLDNLSLSNKRALKVYEYFLMSDPFRKLSNTEQEFIRQNMISCGYSYAKSLDSHGKLLAAGGTYDKDKSRRVEFRIIIGYKTQKDEN